jgi:hypothetical protein
VQKQQSTVADDHKSHGGDVTGNCRPVDGHGAGRGQDEDRIAVRTAIPPLARPGPTRLQSIR